MVRIYISLISIIILLISMVAPAQNISDKKYLTGSWLGKISAGAIELRVIFNLSIVEKDSLVATLDSPDQGAKGIKLGPVTYTGESIKISAGALLAEYNGTIKNDTIIEGTWMQAGTSNVLNLVKQRVPIIQNRPQEPKPPYSYKSEDLAFTNEIFNIKLSGTLTIPPGTGPFPSVIMITGSGPQNRNEELMGHKPFMVIADYLSRNGIAVLRYDDRGVGGSQGNYSAATSADLATDAEAAFKYLKGRSGIDPEAIGLIGHSEGGLIAALVAASNEEISFIVSLAGTGITGEKIIHRQTADLSRASGVDEKQIKEAASINKKLFAVLKKESDNNKASEKMTALYKQILEKKRATPEEAEKAIKQIEAGLNPAGLTWLRYFIMTNPAHFWKKVNCPVLALNGEKDLQVAADENLPAIEKALRTSGNNYVKTLRLPELNHLFQHCTTGLPSEYSSIEETFSADVLRTIADWILAL